MVDVAAAGTCGTCPHEAHDRESDRTDPPRDAVGLPSPEYDGGPPQTRLGIECYGVGHLASTNPCATAAAAESLRGAGRGWCRRPGAPVRPRLDDGPGGRVRAPCRGRGGEQDGERERGCASHGGPPVGPTPAPPGHGRRAKMCLPETSSMRDASSRVATSPAPRCCEPRRGVLGSHPRLAGPAEVGLCACDGHDVWRPCRDEPCRGYRYLLHPPHVPASLHPGTEGRAVVRPPEEARCVLSRRP